MLILFIIVFIGGIFLKDLLMPNDDSAAYGTRLEDIKNHPIDEEVYTKMKADLASNSNVLEITHRLQGRTVNIILTVDDKATYQDATKIGDTILSFFTEDTKGYYTIQIFVVKKNKELSIFRGAGSYSVYIPSIIKPILVPNPLSPGIKKIIIPPIAPTIKDGIIIWNFIEDYCFHFFFYLTC